jgi:hypothetical protein
MLFPLVGKFLYPFCLAIPTYLLSSSIKQILATQKKPFPKLQSKLDLQAVLPGTLLVNSPHNYQLLTFIIPPRM